jgi:hypothetical protein
MSDLRDYCMRADLVETSLVLRELDILEAKLQLAVSVLKDVTKRLEENQHADTYGNKTVIRTAKKALKELK